MYRPALATPMPRRNPFLSGRDGIVLAFSIPMYRNLTQTSQLKGAAENIAAQLRLSREKAIATGQSQTMHFTANYPPGTDCDYHIHNGAVVGPCWALPNGISFSSSVSPTMFSDGRSNVSGTITLQDQRGHQATVSVQTSGLVLVGQ